MAREFRFTITVPLPGGHFDYARVLSQLEAVVQQTKQAIGTNGIADVSYSESVVVPRGPVQKQSKPASDNPHSETKDKH